MSDKLSSDALAALRDAVGPAGLVTDETELEPHLTEWRGLFRGRAAALLLPASTAAAAAAVRVCADNGIGMVPQGGNTGLVGGAIPASTAARPEVIIGASRLNRVRNLDAANYTITVEAGCILANLQAAAAEVDRLFPLSLGAEGSCQIGGNISCNAGGINVLRYGNTRDLVLGLEVVLPNGDVFDGLRGLRKDNTGYDLKHLFIGAEGTLGFITAATCKLFQQPRSTATALVGVADPAAAVALYDAARSRLGDSLVAFELINRLALDMVLRHIPGCREPLERPRDWHILMELGAADEDASRRLEDFLAAGMTSGLILDGVVAQSERQRADLWHLRHSISEAQKLDGAGIKHDVSVPVSRVDELIRQASAAATAHVPGIRVVAFGHIGDGNIHFNLNQPVDMERQAFLSQWKPVSREVHDIVAALGGSFSAEHGVGTLKRDDLARYRGGVELELMRTLKTALDPAGLMNPGKLFS
ncbi:MAG: FAD-binding oxidoreductase [Gammaproteobacteria bacterium]|nr:FAD-binding oxidoreductase [Gammaproteobacteria bacterium]